MPTFHSMSLTPQPRSGQSETLRAAKEVECGRGGVAVAAAVGEGCGGVGEAAAGPAGPVASAASRARDLTQRKHGRLLRYPPNMAVSCCRVHRYSIWGLLAILTAIAGAVVLPRPPSGAEPRNRRDIRAATVEPRSHVTSSELPKQIPAPPSRTVMQHRPTPALVHLQLRWEDRQRPSVTLPPRLFTPTVQRYTHRTDLLPNIV